MNIMFESYDNPQVPDFNRFCAKHQYFTEYLEWKRKGLSHLVPPFVYITMPFNYPDTVHTSPWSAFIYLWSMKDEICYETGEDAWHEILQSIDRKELIDG